MNYFVYQMPYGRLTIAADEAAITNIEFGEVPFDCPRRPSALTNRAANQLQEYFAGKRTSFDLPLNPKGTPFQLAVWEQLRAIPYGTTVSYGDVARSLGKPKAFRAVGMANNSNPIPILIPCHRVIGANGRLVGYGGGLKIKRILLEVEGISTKNIKD